jgi:hypothetical protein
LRDSIDPSISYKREKMKLAKHTIMRIAAVLSLSAAATSAFAQDGGYRRSYDAGYDAGQRDSRDYRDERGGYPEWNRVHIMEAEYGARGSMCDARRAVRQEVQRNRGRIEVGNQLCGDPAVNVPKRLRVVYRCSDSAPARVVARENEILRLTCRR